MITELLTTVIATLHYRPFGTMTIDTPINHADLLDHAVTKVLSGDREAFRSIIVTCQSSLSVLVASILPRNAAVEDVVQQSFMIAFRKLPSYPIGKSGKGFHAWISAIARCEALNERRRMIADQKMLSQFTDHRRIQDSVGIVLERGIDLDTAIFTHLHDCLIALDERASAVLRAHYYDNQDTDEIAKHFGRNASWARVTLYRARQALGECLRMKGALNYEQI